MIAIGLPLLVCLLGLGLHLRAHTQRWIEVGRMLFFAGLLVTLLGWMSKGASLRFW